MTSTGATTPATTPAPTRHVAIVLFDGFELLDVFGPVQLWGVLRDHVAVTLLGPAAGLVRSSQGTRVEATASYADAPAPDVVLVPGGAGTRALVRDEAFLAWLARWSADAALVTSVCTGSAVLAAAGLLDGYRATSNKYAFGWASTHGAEVSWTAQARWVADRDRWTSSGVAAGMDMTVALIGHLFGPQAAQAAATFTEFDAHTDPAWDPFAACHGLV